MPAITDEFTVCAGEAQSSAEFEDIYECDNTDPPGQFGIRIEWQITHLGTNAEGEHECEIEARIEDDRLGRGATRSKVVTIEDIACKGYSVDLDVGNGTGNVGAGCDWKGTTLNITFT